MATHRMHREYSNAENRAAQDSYQRVRSAARGIAAPASDGSTRTIPYEPGGATSVGAPRGQKGQFAVVTGVPNGVAGSELQRRVGKLPAGTKEVEYSKLPA